MSTKTNNNFSSYYSPSNQKAVMENFNSYFAGKGTSNLGHPSNLDAKDFFMYEQNASNVFVNEEVALNYSAVWAATSLLCSLSGILPLAIWVPDKKTGKMKKSLEHNLSTMLAFKPNNHMTPYDVKKHVDQRASQQREWVC